MASKRVIRNTKPAVKGRSNVNFDDDEKAPSIISTDIESDIGEGEFDANYQVQSTQSPTLRTLEDFFNDAKMINPSGASTTNIVNRQSGKCYNVPSNKIPKMFKLMEQCRRQQIYLMFNEKQNDPSGIMIDFDIFQETEDDQLTDDLFIMLCNKVVECLHKIVNFTEKKESIFIGITRRPKITYDDDRASYKDGFHMIIPSIQISRGVKRLLLKMIIDNEIMDQVFSEVQPASILHTNKTTYQRQDFLDLNSAFVPTFFIGSSTKKGALPYELTHVYEVILRTESKGITVHPKLELFNKSSVNLCYEFSLNWECSGGLIKKKPYTVQDKYAQEAYDLEAKHKKQDDELAANYGKLSLNSIHDVQIKEIKELLDTLNPRRADDYTPWFEVLCVLASISPSYKDLAEYFSRKSPKFKLVEFESVWNSIISKNKKTFTIGSLYYWAKLDNPDRYTQHKKGSIFEILLKMVYEGYKEGILNHSDIAKILHKALPHKYVTDIPEGERKRVWYEFILEEDHHIDGELYKWHRHDEPPVSLSMYISNTLPNLFEDVFKTIKRNFENSEGTFAKYYGLVLKNFKATMRKLGDKPFKKHVLAEAEEIFNKRGFSSNLDKDPLIRGVQNGILKLSLAPQGRPLLISGYHGFYVSKYTTAPYIPFNPHDEITKKLLYGLRNLFPDDEPDSFEFTMSYLSSTIDGNPKESMFMIMKGEGSNGKSFLVELHKAAIGGNYGVKMPLQYLIQRASNAENATPALMSLKDASFAYYSESDKRERLNASKVKEVTGLETMSGRKMYGDQINFKPKCHHLVTTNYDFEIDCDDWGTWRRITYNPLKITFINASERVLNKDDPYQRVADADLTQKWTEDPEIQGRYLGVMVWYHYWLYRKYKGKVKAVPHPHIEYETACYRKRQDLLSLFIAQRFVKTVDAEAQFPFVDEVRKYIVWYQTNIGTAIAAKGLIDIFKNSEIGKHIKTTSRGDYIVGHRFLGDQEKLAEGETYAKQNVYKYDLKCDIAPETPDQFYARICSEFEMHKHIFNNDESNDVDADILRVLARDATQANNASLADYESKNQKIRHDNVEIDGQILPTGIIIRQLDEPSINYLTDDYHFDVNILPDIGDIIVDSTENNHDDDPFN